jgi:chromosomal replication initiator protein
MDAAAPRSSTGPALMIPSSGSSLPSVERFLVLGENKLAFTAVERLLKRPSRSAGALTYLYGPSGTGKSHLVRHLVRELRSADPGARIVSLTASEFANEFAESAEKNRLAEFVERFRACDLFACEDLQTIGRRGETQRLLVTILDEVAGSGGHVLITSSTLPGVVPGLQPRLLSRCRGGVHAGMGLPGMESRVSLLSHFASARQLAISPEAVEEIAALRPGSPRDLQAILLQLETAARHHKARLDRAFVQRILRGEEQRQKTTLNDVARAVARHFGVRMADLKSSTRQQGLAVPRQCAMYLGRSLTNEPLTKIAVFFGRKNHTAVIHACRRTQSSIEEEPALRQHLAQIRAALGAADSGNGTDSKAKSR